MTAISHRSARAARGFSLIEVLVALVILSVGLLGLGLLQATSLKASFGANHRTVATNLAYQLLDMVRANRLWAYRYAYITTTDFAGINPATCNPQPVGGVTGDLVSDDIQGWECQVVHNLPGGEAVVTLNAGGVPGAIAVTIDWTDARFKTTEGQTSTFTLASQL